MIIEIQHNSDKYDSFRANKVRSLFNPGRGRNAIKAAYKKGEPLSAATWFWASDGLDAGDICEQEIVRIDYDLRPRDFYASRILPAMFRTLERAIAGISAGVARRVPQMHEHATYG